MAARKPESPTGIFRAVSSGTFKVRGQRMSYIRGQTYPAGFPLIRIRPDAFEPLSFDADAARAAAVRPRRGLSTPAEEA